MCKMYYIAKTFEFFLFMLKELEESSNKNMAECADVCQPLSYQYLFSHISSSIDM